MNSSLLETLWRHDREFSTNAAIIAGVDEVGRGPLAGNVVAACVVLNLHEPIIGVYDSKKLSAHRRKELDAQIRERAQFIGLGEASPREIEKWNILQATFLAMKRAIANSGCKPELLLVDGRMKLPGYSGEQRCLVKGDSRSASIAAASIVAKVARDRQMQELHQKYPQYGFDSNKGYGSSHHLIALEKFGMIECHRRNFKPIKLYQTDIFSSSLLEKVDN